MDKARLRLKRLNVKDLIDSCVIKSIAVYAAVAMTLVFFLLTIGPLNQAQASISFTFTAVGDYGANSNTSAVLLGMAPTNTGSSFNLALGDLSYGSLRPETAWCNYVKARVGDTFPFQLVAGNHEDDTPAGYNIDKFALCLPNRIGNITGTYAREYYFDYPPASPLARVILISPNLTFLNEGRYSYSAGSAHYNWVASAIDGARAARIPWIIVGMHRNCITVGIKSCEIGTDLLNLLVEKRVDFILQGHDHDYQRSKQLALTTPSCTSILANTYNPSCVVDDGADGTYTKGAGSVLIIVGSGGISLYNVNRSDSEAGYFGNWMGANSNPTYGFLKVEVTGDYLSASFVPSVGTFADSFTVSASPLSEGHYFYFPIILK